MAIIRIDTNGKFEKDDLIHMLDTVFGVEHDYIIKDTGLLITVSRHRREANFIENDLSLTETKKM